MGRQSLSHTSWALFSLSKAPSWNQSSSILDQGFCTHSLTFCTLLTWPGKRVEADTFPSVLSSLVPTGHVAVSAWNVA